MIDALAGLLGEISIHAPVKGATPIILTYHTKSHNFNPRSREGSDLCTPPATCTRTDFNPRSREGSDCVSAVHMCLPLYFNPRSREGSDQLLIRLRIQFRISIHAPVKGATVCML